MQADVDEKRDVSKEEAMQFAENNKIGFLETSALTGQNIEFAFKKLVEGTYRLFIFKQRYLEAALRKGNKANSNLNQN